MVTRFSLSMCVLTLLVACQSAVEIPPDLTPADMFQEAQDASATRNYRAAMAYYEEFGNRFGESPAELERLLWADYEVAFLHHKLGDDAAAIVLFDELVASYEKAEATAWPPGPLTLARRVLADLRPAPADPETGGS